MARTASKKSKAGKKSGSRSRKRRVSRKTASAVPSGLQAGQPAPDFRLASDNGHEIGLSDLKGRKVVLYFYPKDNTPGCTIEACSFRDGHAELEKRGAVVVGMSADSVDTHRNFKQKYHLNFSLLSDPEKKVLEAYGVWKEKSLYGRTFMGIVRSTFIIDRNGTIAKIFPQVKVHGHFEEVLASL
ncbi:MAG: thioredoxin-dependent thiol peroxidase [Nitrospirae bacterium]|nr:thioredoxin-dependent thiol peroxidase [Nitrospirota bacterium]